MPILLKARTLLCKNAAYEIFRVRGKGLIRAEQFGIRTDFDDCCRWYAVTYELANGLLLLREMKVMAGEEKAYLPMGEVLTEISKSGATYSDMNVPVPFAGRLMIAKDLMPLEEMGMIGFYEDDRAPVMYRTVLDVMLQDGKVVTIEDRSIEFDLRRRSLESRVIRPETQR